MVFLFQLVESTDLARKAFEISPTSIYGWVLAASTVLNIAFCVVIVYLWKTHLEEQKERKEMLVNMTTVILNNTHVIERVSGMVTGLSAEHKNIIDTLKESIRASEERIIVHLKR